MFTVEPDLPLGGLDDSDTERMKHVEGFNQWIAFIQSANETHHIAFMPLFGGTLVALTKKFKGKKSVHLAVYDQAKNLHLTMPSRTAKIDIKRELIKTLSDKRLIYKLN